MAEVVVFGGEGSKAPLVVPGSEEHTSELQSLTNLVCRLLLEKKKNKQKNTKVQATSQSKSKLHEIATATTN